MQNRLAALQARLADAPFELLALVPGPNYFYATGAALHASERLNLLLIPAEGEPVALAPSLEAPYLHPLGLAIYEWRDEVGPTAALHQLVADRGWASPTIGVEFGVMRVGEREALRAALPDARVVAADGLLAELRAIKDEAELRAIRHAVAVTEQGLHATVGSVRAGMTEREVAALLKANLLAAGADEVPFALVVSGPRCAEPHAGASDRTLAAGDGLIVDCGAKVGHYVGDITRCLALEPVPAELERIYALCLAANEAGRAVAAPGVTGHAVDAAARRVIEEGGYGQFFIHRTGHGLGLETHEPPYMVSGNEEPLRPGNVFTVEPGIYVPGLGGVRVEDDMVVTAGGSESLTQFPRALIRIPSASAD